MRATFSPRFTACPASFDECATPDLCVNRCHGLPFQVAGAATSASKPTNPKDALASNKVPLHLWPETASALGAMAFLDGASKYGRSNWRVAGVRASIYVDAARRHLALWFEGEDADPDSGLPHLAHVLACVAILVDAQAAGKLTDDRQVRGGYRPLLDALTPEVNRVRERHADKNPTHFDICSVDGQDKTD